MPDRVVRDEILTSERYWSVGIEAQQLFIHLLLRADSLGRFSGKNFTIRMACYPGHARNPDIVEKLISDLHDADLIRLYHVDSERFIFIPRYRQRLRYLKSKYPAPPNEINDIEIEKSGLSQTTVRPQSAEVKRSEEKRSKALTQRNRKISIPENFKISSKIKDWAQSEGIFNLADHFEYFVNYANASGRKYIDWDAAFRNAIKGDWAKVGKGVNPDQPQRQRP